MASTFKHDSAGFLVGDLIDVNHDLLDAQNAGMAVWRGIRSDVKAIARALGVQARTAALAAKSEQRATSDSGRSRGASGRFSRQVATPAGRSGSGAGRTGSSGTGTQRTAPSAAERSQSTTRTATVTAAGRSRVRTAGLDRAATQDAVDTRDALGRFAGGGKEAKVGGGGGTSDKGVHDAAGLLTNAIGKLGNSLEGTDQLDPTIAAMKEVKEAVSPLGRGMFSMFGRTAERKKEAWHKRLLKAITGKKETPAGGMGGGESVKSGSFMGTLMGELAPKVMLFLLPILTAIGGVLLGGLALLGGVKLGEFIYKWLTDSGLMAKIFDAIDAAKQVILGAADWGKKKYEAAKETVKAVVSDFQKGSKEKTDPASYAPPVLDASGRNVNDPRRIDRDTAVNSDGRMINDPRRLDAAPLAELPPATSIVQRAGRVWGGIRRLLGVDGTKRMYENADGSTETRSGGSVSWRNNNPGNLKLEYAGSADSTVKTKRTKEQALKAAQSRYEGVVDLDQWGNAIFSTEEAGRAAKAKLLTGAHGGKTIEEMLPKYAVNDYSGQANHKAYATGIHKTAAAQGVDLRGKKISDLNPQEMSALLDGMKKVEGFKAGTVSPLAMPKGIPAMAAYSAGATVSAGAARIPPVAIPSSVPERIAPMPDAAIPAQLNNAKQAQVRVSMREPIGQDVGDRSIAHVVSGGLGHIG
jgi:hypothetical protein